MAPRYTDQILEVRRALWKFEVRQTDPMIKSHCRIIRGNLRTALVLEDDADFRRMMMKNVTNFVLAVGEPASARLRNAG